MQEDLKKISDHWGEIYSRQVEKYKPFEISGEFKRFASVFAPGNSYLYIVNLHNFEIEYISDSVKRYVNKEAGEVHINDLLQTVVPEEIEILKLKSKVNSDFYTSFLDKERVLQYKNVFTYRLKDARGKLRTMLYQAIPLSVLENGTPEHVFCIHTDVSHLKMASTSDVSFIHMDGGKSYYNVNISTGKFDPSNCEETDNELVGLLSEREKQIVMRLSRGLNAEQIAEELNLSPHTIKTHRRNVLKKSGCTNTAELVAKCLTNGIISPGMN
ncbi:MAG: LuxR C-terminal-related transcriptional regulator [Salinimicrobium sp.]